MQQRRYSTLNYRRLKMNPRAWWLTPGAPSKEDMPRKALVYFANNALDEGELPNHAIIPVFYDLRKESSSFHRYMDIYIHVYYIHVWAIFKNDISELSFRLFITNASDVVWNRSSYTTIWSRPDWRYLFRSNVVEIWDILRKRLPINY